MVRQRVTRRTRNKIKRLVTEWMRQHNVDHTRWIGDVLVRYTDLGVTHTIMRVADRIEIMFNNPRPESHLHKIVSADIADPRSFELIMKRINETHRLDAKRRRDKIGRLRGRLSELDVEQKDTTRELARLEKKQDERIR